MKSPSIVSFETPELAVLHRNQVFLIPVVNKGVSNEFSGRNKYQQFTAFSKLKLDFSRGLNVFIGDNSTGKTHLLKLLYAALNVTQPPLQGSKAAFPIKVLHVFMPEKSRMGHLVRFGSAQTKVEISRDDSRIAMNFTKTNRGVFRTGICWKKTGFRIRLSLCLFLPRKYLHMYRICVAN